MQTHDERPRAFALVERPDPRALAFDRHGNFNDEVDWLVADEGVDFGDGLIWSVPLRARYVAVVEDEMIEGAELDEAALEGDCVARSEFDTAYGPCVVLQLERPVLLLEAAAVWIDTEVDGWAPSDREFVNLWMGRGADPVDYAQPARLRHDFAAGCRAAALTIGPNAEEWGSADDFVWSTPWVGTRYAHVLAGLRDADELTKGLAALGWLTLFEGSPFALVQSSACKAVAAMAASCGALVVGTLDTRKKKTPPPSLALKQRARPGARARQR